MGRSKATRGLAKDRVYEFKLAARIIGVSLNTFRKFPSRGLRIVDGNRPKLVRGADLISFLDKQAKARKLTGLRGQFLCMRCHAKRDALGGLADYIPINSATGRLVAFCSTCEAQCSAFSSPAKAMALADVLEIRFADVA